MSPPRLSLVAPTMGKPNGILRMMDSLIHQAPDELLASIELIVFLNIQSGTNIDTQSIENYLRQNSSRFGSVQFIKADKYYMTAEESACAATAFATGEYLWIVGDKRIFLPEGLEQLARYIKSPQTPCAYFNSVWQDSTGQTNAHVSTYLSRNTTTISYKDFVQRNGINFMATNMGTWIYKRHFLDLPKWQHIISTCGPHFSHVATLLATMGRDIVTCHAQLMCVLEAKAYHNGDNREWQHYAKISKTHRYYAWTFGLTRQFQYLINNNHYTYMDVRRSMCIEGLHIGRQIDEIYKHLVSQIWIGRYDIADQISESEFNEIISFLTKACPERAIVNGMLRRLYTESLKSRSFKFIKDTRAVLRAIQLDGAELKLSSLIVGQISGEFVRLHPAGYLISSVTDNEKFLCAYKITDAPKEGGAWRLMDDEEFKTPDTSPSPRDVEKLHPITAHKFILITYKIKRITRALIRQAIAPFYDSGLADLVPKKVIYILWKRRI